MKGMVWKLLYERTQPNKFNITKLKRAEKRKSSTEGSDLDTTSRKYTCKSSFLMADKTDICFFVRGLFLARTIFSENKKKTRQGKTLQVQKLEKNSQVQDKNLKVQKFVNKSNL